MVDTCYECTERHEACHGHCQKYLDALDEFRKAKIKADKERNISCAIQGLHLNRREKRKR